VFIPDYSSTSGLIGDSGKRLPVRQFIKTIFHIASYCIGTRAIKKLGDCPRVFLRMAFARLSYAPTGRKVIAQGKAKRRPGIRCARKNPSPERAEPAVRQSMRACSALSGLWRIGAAAYLGRSRTTQGGASLYPGLSHFAPLGQTIRLRIGVQKTRGLSPSFLVVYPARAQTQLPGGLSQIAQPLALVGSRRCRSRSATEKVGCLLDFV